MSSAITSAGLGALIAALVSHIVSSRFVEKHKSKLELRRHVISRYSDQQFHTINSLWSNLYDLKGAGQKLWDEASAPNLTRFAAKLHNAITALEKAGLLLEDEDFVALDDLLSSFADYMVGKTRLIKVKSGNQAGPLEVQQMVRDNHGLKIRYEQHLAGLRPRLRNRLLGLPTDSVDAG